MRFRLIIVLGSLAVGLAMFAHGKSQQIYTSSSSYVSCTTGSIGGGALLVGTPATGTATCNGTSAGRPCIAAPSDGTSLTSVGTGLGMTVGCMVTASNTPTVYLNVSVAGTPTAKTYNVVVFP